MKITDKKMETMFKNAKAFTSKHDGSMWVREYYYITQDMTRRDALFDAIGNAYDLGFRRGYNKAIKEGKVNR